MMLVEHTENVTMWPDTVNEIETTLEYALATYGHPRPEYGFDIEVGGEHLPEGQFGPIDNFHCCVSLNVDQVRKLRDELARWLNEHGSS
jgi:hypothetical protein